MANWFCSVFNVVCRRRLSSPRCRSELIDSAWVGIQPGSNTLFFNFISIFVEAECVYLLAFFETEKFLINVLKVKYTEAIFGKFQLQRSHKLCRNTIHVSIKNMAIYF